MIDLEKGDLLLCHSDLVINGNTQKDIFENDFSDLIAFKYTVEGKHHHYYCWFDIEKDSYMYACITFCNHTLNTIRLYPQHKATNKLTSQPKPLRLEEAQRLSHAWYLQYSNQDELFCKWGKIKYCKGDDPIYSPTCVLLEYERI